MEFRATQYKLQSCKTGRIFDDQGWMLSDPQDNVASLIRALYEKKQIEIKDNSYGIYNFADWLPIKRMLQGSSAPLTYRSEKLARHLKLNNLFITFSGYWPERGVEFETCSFKETEAFSVCARLDENNEKKLVVASAGNTARAFCYVCSENNIPLVVAIPEDNIGALWFKKELNSCVKVISVPKGSDYFDAIALSAKLCAAKEFLEEGGAKNVARRDGMGTTVLSAAEVIGHIPDYYFQAVGSGTGTIAAYEANLRLIEDGRWGDNLMTLIASQNIPFVPMYEAFKADNRNLAPIDEEEGRRCAQEIIAKVLSNRKPPYSLAGGLYDSLKATKGDMEIATNQEIIEASELFEKLEGIDIHPAAGCAVASLIKGVNKGIIDSDKVVMLNITGGGEKYCHRENNHLYYKSPDMVFSTEAPQEEVVEKVLNLF